VSVKFTNTATVRNFEVNTLDNLKTVWSGDSGRKTGVKCPYLNFPLNLILKKSKAVPLHAMEALGRRGSIAPTQSLSQH
jgi:hypothetical protein